MVALSILVLTLPAVLLPFQATPEAEGLLPYGGARQRVAAEGGSASSDVAFSYANPTFLCIGLGVAAIATVVMAERLARR